MMWEIGTPCTSQQFFVSVYYCRPEWWRVQYEDGDVEEIERAELEKGMALATKPEMLKETPKKRKQTQVRITLSRHVILSMLTNF
jgi:hypothetical protein